MLVVIAKSTSKELFFNVFVSDTFEIQPSSEYVVKMHVAVNRASFIGMFEPCQSKLTKYGLLGASAIINCVDNSIPVRLLNVSDSSITVNSNFVVGMLSECSADNNDETFTKFRSIGYTVINGVF